MKHKVRALSMAALAAAIGLVAVIVGIRAADDGTGMRPAIQPSPTPPANAVLGTDYLIDLNTGEMTSLPESIVRNGSSDWYAVSPDGTIVAYGS